MTREPSQVVPTEELPSQPLAAPSGSVLSRITRIPTFRALQFRDFRYLWIAQLNNSAAIWMENVARPIVILELTGSAVHLGMVLATRTFPQFFFGLLAGVLADWFDRKTLLILSQSVAVLLDLILAILFLTGVAEIWHVYVTTFLKGVTMSFDQPARQSLIPSLVPRDHLANAVALNSASMNTMRIGGTSIGGLLLAVVGIGTTFLIVSLVGALGVIFTLLVRAAPRQTELGDRGVRAAFSSFAEGVRYAWDMRPVRELLLLMLGFFAIAMSYMQVFAPLLAKQTMGIGDAGYGLMMSAAGIGALIGALIVATLSPSRRRGAALLFVVAGSGSFLTLYAASTYLPHIALTFVLFGLVGTGQSAFVAVGTTVLVQATPQEKRGRIMGIMSMDRSMITLGGAIAGFLAAAIGAQLAQITFGLALVVFAVLGALGFASLRRFQ